MPNKNKPSLDEIFNAVCGITYREADPDRIIKAKQAILQYFSDRYIGDDERKHTDKECHCFPCGDVDVRNNLRDKQRSKLKADGWEVQDESNN